MYKEVTIVKKKWWQFWKTDDDALEITMYKKGGKKVISIKADIEKYGDELRRIINTLTEPIMAEWNPAPVMTDVLSYAEIDDDALMSEVEM